MTDIVLFHHAQGLTTGVLAFAEQLRAAGHQVTTPDLYDGAVFATLDDGVANARSIGMDAICDLGLAAVEGLGSDVVYAGFSLGGMPAQQLAQTRPGARGALLFHSCIAVAAFGTGWPDGVPVQIHAMDHDPFFVDDGDIEAARELVAEVEQAELLLYPGNGHLFADDSLPGFDATAADLLQRRVLTFLDGLAWSAGGSSW